MYDEDLTPVLEATPREDLDPLVEFLLQPRTSLLERDDAYIAHHPAHERYIGAIVKEIRLFGGHTVGDRIKGAPGRPWRVIVKDALEEMGVKRPPLAIAEMERRVVELALDVEFEDLPEQDQRDLLDSFYSGAVFEDGLTQYSVLDELITRQTDDPSQISLDGERVKRVLGKKAWRAARSALAGKLVSTGLKFALHGAAGPLGWGLTAWSFLGPAYRVTIPVICYISYLRRRHLDQS